MAIDLDSCRLIMMLWLCTALAYHSCPCIMLQVMLVKFLQLAKAAAVDCAAEMLVSVEAKL